jgi:L-fucose isomerase-like protein
MNNILKVVIFSSPLHDQESVMKCRQELLNELRSSYNVEFIESKELNDTCNENCSLVAFIATGGVEEQFTKKYEYLSKPILLISDSYHNSLAATMEISTWLDQNKISHRHFNFPFEPSRKYLNKFEVFFFMMLQIQKAYLTISRMNVGIIGGESPWLIASAIDKSSVTNRYGTNFVEISITEVQEMYDNTTISCKETEKMSRLCSCLVGDRTEKHLEDAIRLFITLKSISRKYSLNALTIKCFDLLTSCRTTACLALALLNDEGIISGCEGDIPALWSMIIAYALCGSSSFMVNPSSIERVDNTIDFSHCTAPLSLGKSFTLPSHYESRSGIGIASKLPPQNFTLFKCGGKELDKYYAFEGDVIQNTNVVERCRAQVKFQFKNSDEVDEYLASHLGNHSILIPGKHKEKIFSFFGSIK